MERTVLWLWWENDGTEMVDLGVEVDDTFEINGAIVGVIEGTAMHVTYRIVCDHNWYVREFSVTTYRYEPALHSETIEQEMQRRGVFGFYGSFALRSDVPGFWENHRLQRVVSLDGCIDVDLRATPFTNTLPIRRLGLKPGESAEIKVLYVDFPSLKVSPQRQRYTNMGIINGVQHYKFESLEVDFEAVLPVDDDGIVLDYPGLFRRIKYP